MSDQHPPAIPPPPFAASAVPPAELSELETKVQALLQEAEQQQSRYALVKSELHTKLGEFSRSEGGELVGAAPLIAAIETLAAEHDTQQSLLVDSLRLMNEAVQGGDDEGDEGPDDEEGEPQNVLFDADGETVVRNLGQYKAMLAQTLATLPEGDMKRQVKRFLQDCEDALEIALEASVDTTGESPDAGAN